MQNILSKQLENLLRGKLNKDKAMSKIKKEDFLALERAKF